MKCSRLLVNVCLVVTLFLGFVPLSSVCADDPGELEFEVFCSAGGVVWHHPVVGKKTSINRIAPLLPSETLFKWDFGDGLETYDAPGGYAEHTWPKPGGYTVSIEVTEPGVLPYVVTLEVEVLYLWEGDGFHISSTYEHNKQGRTWDVPSLTGNPNAKAVSFSGPYRTRKYFPETFFCGSAWPPDTPHYIRVNGQRKKEFRDGCFYQVWGPWGLGGLDLPPAAVVTIDVEAANVPWSRAELYAERTMFLWRDYGASADIPMSVSESRRGDLWGRAVTAGKEEFPIPDLGIAVGSEDGLDIWARTTTDGAGNFRFFGLEPGEYWVRVVGRDLDSIRVWIDGQTPEVPRVIFRLR